MPPQSNAKGDRRERELVNRLDELGFAVMRAPASGSATSREQPDVLAGDGSVFYAIEVKASAGNPIYLDEKEVYDLVYFAENFGALARLGVRFDREDWYFFHPYDEHVHRTDGGNYRIKKETALDHGETIEDLPSAGSADDDGDRTDEILRAVQRGHLGIDDARELL